MGELFHDHRIHPADPTTIEGEIGHSFTKEEVIHDMKVMKNGTSSQQDEVSINPLKFIYEEHLIL